MGKTVTGWWNAMILSLLALTAMERLTAQPARAPLTREQFGGLMHELVKESIPIVEYLTQRRFKSPPSIVVGDSQRAIRSLTADFMMQLRVVAPESDGAVLNQLAELTAKQTMKGMLGKYGVSDRTLYLMPENVYYLTREAGVSASNVPELLRLTIIHELVHALHDQHVGLAREVLIHLGKESESFASSAVIEGFATFTEERAAEFLNYPPTFTRVMAIGRIKDSQLPPSVQLAMNRRSETYLSGAKFFHSIHKRGGIEAVWLELKGTVRDPEIISRIIQADGKTGDLGVGSPDIAESLDQLAHILETRGFNVEKQDLSGPQLNAFLGDDSLERARALDPELSVNSLMMRFGSAKGGAAGLILITYCTNPKHSEDLRLVLSRKNRQNAIQRGQTSSGGSDRTLSIMGTTIAISDSTMNNRKATSYLFREGNVVVTGVVTGQALSEPEFGAMLRSAAVSAGQSTKRPQSTPATSQSVQGDTRVSELLTMLSMGFSEQEILETLKSRPLTTPIDSDVASQLKARGASPAILNEVQRPKMSSTKSASPAVPAIAAPQTPKFVDFEITEADLRSIGALE